MEAQAKADAEAERQRTGQKRRGRAPKEVDETPEDKAQMSFTDPELKIMQSPNKYSDKSFVTFQSRLFGGLTDSE